MVLHVSVQVHFGRLVIGRRRHRQRFGSRARTEPRNRRRSQRQGNVFNVTRRDAAGLLLGLLDKLDQMMIFDFLDFVCQHDETTVDLVQFATVELEAEFRATQSESVTPGVLAQHQATVRDTH